ncbi:hypothetical protein HW555_009635 [Spodoptera exigua]|uniref:Uncharacterized protein n=1 Tax=Spodoptera exigua TaxID=7107 RepID=A0A835L6J0_SPOEX|nr:hypothetical protein HW555_009635 [Spodoptera exigua]
MPRIKPLSFHFLRFFFIAIMPRKRTQLSRQTATAKRLRVLRSNETEDENMHRLAAQRAITEQNRARESSVDRSQRLASQNFRTLANRQRESSAERSQRLASQNARTMANRDRESSAERSQRLASQNARSTRNRTRRQHNLLNAAFAYDCTVDYSELNDIDIGRMDKICNLCQAKKWAAETPGLCCSGGKENIPIIPEPTSEFLNFLTTPNLNTVVVTVASLRSQPDGSVVEVNTTSPEGWDTPLGVADLGDLDVGDPGARVTACIPVEQSVSGSDGSLVKVSSEGRLLKSGCVIADSEGGEHRNQNQTLHLKLNIRSFNTIENDLYGEVTEMRLCVSKERIIIKKTDIPIRANLPVFSYAAKRECQTAPDSNGIFFPKQKIVGVGLNSVRVAMRCAVQSVLLATLGRRREVKSSAVLLFDYWQTPHCRNFIRLEKTASSRNNF